MKKVVIDTNIYISAIFWGGKPREIIDLGRDKRIHIFISIHIENEISEKLKIKFKLNKEEIDQILLDFSTFTIPIKINKRIKAIPRDPEDNKFIECAVASMADYIISGDKHILELKEFAGIKILAASEFMAILKKNLK